ncbi:MAG: AAA family ATPase [bacterium]
MDNRAYLCQSCGQRPATVNIKQNVNGRTQEFHLCHTCAEEQAIFGNDGMFSSMLGGSNNLFGGLPQFQAPRRSYINILDYFSDRAKKVISNSVQAARDNKSQMVDTEHILRGLLDEDEITKQIFSELGIKTEDLKAYLEENLIKGEKEVGEPELSPRAKKALEQAFYEARDLGHNYVSSEHIFLGLVKEGEGMAAQVLGKYAVNDTKARGAVLKVVGEGKRIKKKKSNTPTLDEYSTDLTTQAKDGRLDPVIGREDEIERVVQILSRRTKNNPVLIGEPGVGKTAIVEGLATKIVSDDVPENLVGKRVVSLDLSSALSGTKYRGEFEKRIKKVIEEIKKEQRNIILFIDEMHTMVGAGAAEGAIDASNMLKPALARGELQTIGATTLNEYRKHIEKDAALERRFQPILVNEPNVDVSIEILRGLRDRYEAHHKVQISDEAIVAAAGLSDRYLTDRHLPDKAIDLIDEAGAKIRLASIAAPNKLKELEKELKKLANEKEDAKKAGVKSRIIKIEKEITKLTQQKEEFHASWTKDRSTGQPIVLSSDIEEVLSKWTGIPVQELAEEEVEKLLHLENRLHERIIGQEEAVTAVSEAVRRGRSGLKDPKRPVGSFIFLGPTGVGKTELAKALAEQLFGDESAIVRVDMSEYMERHNVSKLIGAPPGYVGYEEPGQLTEKVRQKPYSIVLLDEIEKAHPDVFNVLLQILEDGQLTDSKGRLVDFKNVVIIATSNLGSNIIQDAAVKKFGFEDKKGKKDEKGSITETIKGELMQELKKAFRPEFLNRIDDIIIFQSLNRKQIKQIVNLMLDDVQKLLQGQNIKLKVTDGVKRKLVEEGFEPSFGARPLRRVIQKKIENRLSNALLTGDFRSGNTIRIELGRNGEFNFIKEKSKRSRKKAKV